MAKKKPNLLQQMVRGVIREAINAHNGTKPERSINSPSVNSEAWHRDKLARELNGETEVQTPVGRIDILTKTEVIEVKRAIGWKSAIGQVKSYGRYYPNHRLRIHLFGHLTQSRLAKIQEHCLEESITVTIDFFE
jgi:hypothetical protein